MVTRSGVMTRKGQVTIPADLRKELGLEVGDRIVFERDGNGIHVEKRVHRSLVDDLSGSMSAYATRTGLTGQELIAADKEAFAQAILDDWAETERRMRSDYSPE